MKLRYEIDYKGLEQYLMALERSEIETDWNKPENPKLIEGHTLKDVEFFKTHGKYQQETIIQYGEPFLVDALGNDLSVVMLTRRRYKLPTGRIINGIFITTIIDDCRAVFKSPLNGVWKIPKQFIKPHKILPINKSYRK